MSALNHVSVTSKTTKLKSLTIEHIWFKPVINDIILRQAIQNSVFWVPPPSQIVSQMRNYVPSQKEGVVELPLSQVVISGEKHLVGWSEHLPERGSFCHNQEFASTKVKSKWKRIGWSTKVILSILSMMIHRTNGHCSAAQLDVKKVCSDQYYTSTVILLKGHLLISKFKLNLMSLTEHTCILSCYILSSS